MKKFLTSSALAMSLVAFAAPAEADLQAEMNQFFDNLGNTTSPGVVSTARRGAIAGGSVQIRNRIVDTNLVSFTPPSFQGGCGGVDLFGGSFSYVSGDQIVPLFKAVASNAVGYAFQIGLSAICATCMNGIETMQKKVQALNQHFGNSCQLAQGVINDGLDAAGYKRHSDASLINAISGAREDIFDAQNSDAIGDAQEAAPEQVAEEITGNVVWRALVQQDAASHFAFGDIALLEVMMNLTGSVIVAAPVDDGDGTTTPLIHIRPKYELFDAMMDGGVVDIDGCGADDGPNGCLAPVEQTITLEGFQERARRLLLGDETTPGILEKLRTNEQELNDEEVALLSNLPSGAGGMLIRTTSLSEEAGRTFAETVMPHLTTEWARTITEDLIETVGASVTLIESEHAHHIGLLVNQARERLREEVRRRQDLHGPITTVLNDYTKLLAVTEDFIFASQTDSTERP